MGAALAEKRLADIRVVEFDPSGSFGTWKPDNSLSIQGLSNKSRGNLTIRTIIDQGTQKQNG